MDVIFPWKNLTCVIEPFYPKPEGAGPLRIGVERTLQIYFLEHWFNLFDPTAEEAIYDSRAMHRFVGIDLGQEEWALDETTICKFRHLMEKHYLGDEFLHLINQYLHENELSINPGAIFDATIIHAPSSTKNKKKERDPEMHQTMEGNQWYFVMKAHIGVDSKNKLNRSVVATVANVHDSVVVGDLFHG